MKSQHFLLLPLAFAVLQAWADTDTAETKQELDPVVVTGTRQERANMVRFNPKRTIQPMPAGDGADLLQSVPNMSIVRKGGSSGDPLFRGLGGSRLSINADDQFIYGGCSNRMDPPTAYIFPNTYDDVIVIKGPQSVTQGAGLVAGSVQFVRKDPNFDEKPYAVNASATLGSFGRKDAALEAMYGGKYGYIRANASHNESDDYKDGDGNRIHSAFKRDNQMVQLGITPTTDTTIVATYERSRGEAAYADRMMDGSQFDRDAWNLRWTQRHITPWFSELEVRYGQSEIDHVMDTYSLRSRSMGSGMMWNMMSSAVNPKRNTNTGNIKATLDWESVKLQVGLDYLRDKHSERSDRNPEPLRSFRNKAYTPQQNFNQWGAFAEATWQRTNNQKWVAGLRHDRVSADYDFAIGSTYNSRLAITAANKNQTYNLTSGFVRWEQQINQIKYYAGFGVAERAPDYWERRTSTSLRPEQNRQIDAGLIWKEGNVQASASIFGSSIKDFILLETCTTGMNCINGRNVSARRYGAEAEIKWKFMPNWEVGTSLAYTRGSNRTDGLPLAQTPPLEWNSSITYDNGKYSVGALWRVVAQQNRFARGQGNIIGQDISASAGFGVLSLNAGWKINRYATLQAGVDNVFNKRYAEFVSRNGSYADPSAGLKTERVNEPGRTAWVRVQAQF